MMTNEEALDVLCLYRRTWLHEATPGLSPQGIIYELSCRRAAERELESRLADAEDTENPIDVATHLMHEIDWVCSKGQSRPYKAFFEEVMDELRFLRDMLSAADGGRE